MHAIIAEVRVISNREEEERIRSEGPPSGAPVTLTTVDLYEVIAQV
jgi:hypothetical protein